MSRILDVDVKRLRYWQRIGLYPLADRYSWSELSRARTLARLTNEGVSARKLLPYSPILESHHLHGERKKLIMRDGEQLREADSGQWVIDFEAAKAGVEYETRVVSLMGQFSKRAQESFEEEEPEELDVAEEAPVNSGVSLEEINELGLVFLSTGNHEKAIAVLQQAVDHEEAGSRQWFNLSHAYEAAGRDAKARDALLKALDLDPNFADARFNLALTYERLGQTGRAYGQWGEFLLRHSETDEAEKVRTYVEEAYAGGRVIPLRSHVETS